MAETIVIECEDEIEHTDERPTCKDETCPCHIEQAWAELQRIPAYVERMLAA